VREALVRNGFTANDDAKITRHGSLLNFLAQDLAEAPERPELPQGFRFRTVEPEDLGERVAIHQEVWAPSRVTETSYAAVQASWPYRASLDCVVEAPDGRFAAYCLIWPDDENGVGELEPVGVREEFRRRGLGAAVCTFALRRWHEESGRQAIVYCENDAACGLYESIGFRRHTAVVGYSRG
jgi:ribosomal protein S18 acetylase RimI-like enzyme